MLFYSISNIILSHLITSYIICHNIHTNNLNFFHYIRTNECMTDYMYIFSFFFMLISVLFY
jgi:hypothetical protein